MFNNLFLTTACATVFVGTLYPLALEALTGDKISVGAPFFNLTFGPLFVPLLFAVPFGPLLAWKRGDLLGVAQRLMAAFAVGIVARRRDLRGRRRPVGAGAVRRRACAFRDGRRADRSRRAHRSVPRAASRPCAARAAGLPRSAWGTAVAHFGVARDLLGIVCAATWGSERIVALKPAQTVSLVRLRSDLRRHRAAAGSELPRAGREVHRAHGRRVDRRHGAVEAHVSVARHDDQRGGADDARR